jgi:hypothetical protein
MSIKNKLVLYKSVVLPTMIYASVAWGHVSETQLPMLKELLLEIANKTFEKAKEHENPLVREAVDYDETGRTHTHAHALCFRNPPSWLREAKER